MENKFRVWDENKFYYDVGIINNTAYDRKYFNNIFSQNAKINKNITQFTGIVTNDIDEIYFEDICDIKIEDVKDTGFMNSNAGKFMTKHNLSAIRVRFYQEEFVSILYDFYFVKQDGNLLTEKEHYDMDETYEGWEMYDKKFI